jgi:hypothetical protein
MEGHVASLCGLGRRRGSRCSDAETSGSLRSSFCLSPSLLRQQRTDQRRPCARPTTVGSFSSKRAGRRSGGGRIDLRHAATRSCGRSRWLGASRRRASAIDAGADRSNGRDRWTRAQIQRTHDCFSIATELRLFCVAWSSWRASAGLGRWREVQVKRRRKLWVAAFFVLSVAACLSILAPTARHRTGAAPALALPPSPISPATEQVAGPVEEGSISGIVRSDDGNGVKNALVCATTVSSEVFWTPNAACTSTTESSGRYRIAPLASTAYVVSASAEGFQAGSALLGTSIVLGQGQAKSGVDIVLQHGGAKLSGRVLDTTGGPISGATIRVLRQVLPHDTVLATSGAEGRFALWTSPGAVTVLAEAHAYSPVRIAHVAPSSDLVLTLTPGSTLRGTVIADATGDAVPGVEVRALRRSSFNNPIQPSGTSDAEGIFEIHGLQPAQYTLVGEGTGWRGELTKPLVVGLAAHVDGVTLPVSAAAVVTGTVIQNAGEPCARGSVTLGPGAGPPPSQRSASVPTLLGILGSRGAVRFNAVPPGVYAVNVECTDFLLADGPTTVDVGGASIDGLIWKVHPGVRLIVHAVDESDQPAANAHLRLSNEAANNGNLADRPYRTAFVVDADGSYEVTGLVPGVYTLEPDRGYLGEAVEVDARNSTKVDRTIRLAGRGSILVTVQTPDGLGIDKVHVSGIALGKEAGSLADVSAGGQPASPARTSSELGSGPAPATSLGNGRFQIGPLPSGSYRVRVSDGINPIAEPTDWPQGIVRVSAGVARATVVLHRGGSIRGRVVDSGGQPLPDIWVGANCSGNARPSIASAPSHLVPSGRVLSDAEGIFRIEGLADDALCVVRAEDPGAGGVGITKNVRSGDETVVAIAPFEAISGTAAMSEGEPLRRFTRSTSDLEIRSK